MAIKLSLQKVKNEHLGLLGEWFAKAHVNKYMGESEEWLEEIKSNIYKVDNHTCHYIIYLEAIPIGFCQFYNVHKVAPAVWSSEPEHTAGIDFFIGEIDYLGKGFGTQTLIQLEMIIRAKDCFKHIFADPEESNKASVQLLLNCGFRKIRDGVFRKYLL